MTITKTSYRDHGASGLMAYISRDGQAIKDRTGRELSIGEQADFIDQSEEYEFARSIIVSPENGEELTARELELRTRPDFRSRFPFSMTRSSSSVLVPRTSKETSSRSSLVLMRR